MPTGPISSSPVTLTVPEGMTIENLTDDLNAGPGQNTDSAKVLTALQQTAPDSINRQADGSYSLNPGAKIDLTSTRAQLKTNQNLGGSGLTTGRHPFLNLPTVEKDK